MLIIKAGATERILKGGTVELTAYADKQKYNVLKELKFETVGNVK